MSKTDVVFSDIDFNFTRNPISGDIGRKTNDEAIKQSMRNLIRTMHYERLFNSSLGSSVNNLLFEQSSPIIGMMLKHTISQVITNFEPRVDLTEVIVTMKPDDHTIDIEIQYTILGTQALQTFNVILERTR